MRAADSGARSALLTTMSSGAVATADLGEHVADRRDLGLGVGGGAVDDVHEQVGLGGDLERRLERLDQLVGQLPHEADRVGAAAPSRRRAAASRRVVASRVANSRSSTSTPASVRRLSRVDLPAFV